MFKLGIYKIDQFRKSFFKTFLGSYKPISITLYDQIHHLEDKAEWEERILLKPPDNRGAYKRTYHDRFGPMDDHFVKIIQRYVPPESHLKLHDVGISNGITALDFWRKIKEAYPDCYYVGSDYEPFVEVLKNKKIQIVRSLEGDILEIVYPPFVLNLKKPDRFLLYPVNRLLTGYFHSYYTQKLKNNEFLNKIQKRQLCLFSEPVRQEALTDKRFMLKQHDILKPFQDSYHVVRAMNVLNIHYFTKEQFSVIVNNIYQHLVENGLLITGSNQDAGTQINGGIFVKTPTGFQMLDRLGSGSVIEQHIIGYQPCTRS